MNSNDKIVYIFTDGACKGNPGDGGQGGGAGGFNWWEQLGGKTLVAISIVIALKMIDMLHGLICTDNIR